MDRHSTSALAHADHPIAAPLDDASAATLLARAIRRGDERLLDLGCGQAPWLVRALARHRGLRAEGVDLSAKALAQARVTAGAAGVTDRLLLHQRDAVAFSAPHRFDVVLNVGATHAYGGLLPTLRAAHGHLVPGGTVVVGEGFWEREPDRACHAALGSDHDDFTDLATTVDHVVGDGWTPVYGHVSSPVEWDAYEWSWTGSLSRWALDHPGHPDSGEALRLAAEHRDGWLRGYRGTLGFLTLVLRRTTEQAVRGRPVSLRREHRGPVGRSSL